MNPIELDSDVLKVLPDHPGVYRMLDAQGTIIYVGKAKSLKKRVSSYFQKQQDSLKTRVLVSKIVDIKVTLTDTEAEALILEQTLIKKHKPHYNILLKDDKSYPYIHLSAHEFPRLSFHRGPRNKPGEYFGPYVSGLALRETLNVLQKVFKVRQCEDSFFRNRSRPCLQYQINRCTAPCVAKVSQQDYREQVTHTQDFLTGHKSDRLVALWVERMESASNRLDYELAAQLRDQISQMKAVQARQKMVGRRGELDAVAVHVVGEQACVSAVHVRQGEVVGHQNFLLRTPGENSPELILQAFLPQHYLSDHHIEQLPKEIIVGHSFEGMQGLAQSMTEVADKVVRISDRVRDTRAAWLKLAHLNAEQHLEAHLAKRESQRQRYEQLQADLGLDAVPAHIECFDISHTQGEKAQASCVVFDRNGPAKSRYRRFNINGIQPGDDYAAIGQAVYRRYQRQKTEEATLPDIVLIDGGKGQLSMAKKSLDECQIEEICLLSIAKGPERKPGLETIFRFGATGEVEEVSFASGSLLLLQQVRDEAHRFAVAGHRQRRDKSRKNSILEDLPGVGPKRRKQLLTHFGGLQALKKASVEDLSKLPGISDALAADIVAFLREL